MLNIFFLQHAYINLFCGILTTVSWGLYFAYLDEKEWRANQQEENEYGKGLLYCLGLFLAHAERDDNNPMLKREDNPFAVFSRLSTLSRKDLWIEMWFNGASDHLYDLVIPKDYPIDIRAGLTALQNRSLSWGHGFQMRQLPRPYGRGL